jgi:hypothetical protein
MMFLDLNVDRSRVQIHCFTFNRWFQSRIALGVSSLVWNLDEFCFYLNMTYNTFTIVITSIFCYV